MENKTITDVNATQHLSNRTIDRLASFFSLFSDPTRLTLICLLSHYELCVNEIAEAMEMSQSRVSHQLAILRQHDIVTYHRKGKKVVYSLVDNHIKDIFETGLDHVSEKDEEIYQDKKQNYKK